MLKTINITFMKNNVSKIRKSKKMNCETLAKLLNTTRQTIYDIEHGKRGITEENQQKICNIFNCSLNDIYDEDLDVNNLGHNNVKSSVKIKFFKNLLDMEINSSDKLKSKIELEEEFKFIDLDNYAILKNKYNTNGIICTNINFNYMYPTLKNDDLIFVDINNTSFVDNKLFMVLENNYIKIRRIKQPNPAENNYTISSDNDKDYEYKLYNLKLEDLVEKVLGRIIFCFKEL